MLLDNRTAIITGAARGIGAATAQRMAEEGARVAIVDIDKDEAEHTARQIGSMARAFQCDVSQPSAIKTLIDDLIASYGRIDILVNNAGICPRVSIDDMTESLFDKLMNINLKSVFFLSRAAGNAMKGNGWGRIVNLSSTGGRVGGIYNATVYGATKAGILAMTKSFARHYAPYHILVNAVAPGAVETRMMTALADETLQGVIDAAPLKRLADPAEIAHTIVFLASEQASWITGATLDVNGGTLMI
jgi:NAD(P)-dependent dehydrogenase (short-subunit alcohol dehydrogenase family)